MKTATKTSEKREDTHEKTERKILVNGEQYNYIQSDV